MERGLQDPGGKARLHWNGVYESRAAFERSWYEPEPTASLRVIERVSSSPSAAVLDVGAGSSSLVDHLVDNGFTDLTVLDVSDKALAETKSRLGDERAAGVTFLCEDLLAWTPDRVYEIWHDRAVFHFLTDAAHRDRYLALATRAIRVGGHLIIGTFAADGPTHCSGLDVARYAPEELVAVFAASFSLVLSERQEHVTPGGAVQPFTWVVLRRRP